MNKNATKTPQAGPGRPKAMITIPKGKFTFADLCKANGANPETGKRMKDGICTALTLRKFLKRDFALRGRSQVVLVKDETRPPTSEDGLGAPRKVYMRRVATAAAPKSAPKTTLKTARKSTVTVPLDNTPVTATEPAPLITSLGITDPAQSEAANA